MIYQPCTIGDFQTVSHFIISKQNLGFRGKCLDWISSFISIRTMSVKVANSFSGTYTSELGVPQGKVLRPLLFNFCINDMSAPIGAECHFC